MSNPQYRCICGAAFPLPELLDNHIADYQSRVPWLNAELEKCKLHEAYDDGDDLLDTTDDPSPSTKPRVCPVRSCRRAKPFGRRVDLRRHFWAHHKITEFCVYCGQPLDNVRNYLNHVAPHLHTLVEASEIKQQFVRNICRDLKLASDRKLERMEEEISKSKGLKEKDARLNEPSQAVEHKETQDTRKRSTSSAGLEPMPGERTAFGRSVADNAIPTMQVDMVTSTANNTVSLGVSEHTGGFNSEISRWLNIMPMYTITESDMQAIGN